MEREFGKHIGQGSSTLNYEVRARHATQPARTADRVSPAGNRIRVMVADDHPVVRKGITLALGSCPAMELVGEAADGHEALRLARTLAPDVILLDISMPRLHGLAVTETLRKEQPKVRILVLSAHQTPEFVLRVLRAGASGYLIKETPADEILRAVQCVHGGELYFSPQVANVALNQFVRRNVGNAPTAQELSSREREILTYIAEGLSNKEIACKLEIGTRTVETHRERLMRKLNIHSIAGLTKFAIVNGFIPMPELAVCAG